MADKGSKIWTAGIIVVCFALAICIAIMCSQFVIKKDFYMNPSSFLQGVYSVDDGEWKTIDPDTPGYKTQTMSMYAAKEEGVNENTEFTLEIVNPYIQLERYSDSFDITLSHGNGEYLEFFFESFPIIILALLVCFFGIFLFPIASFILGKLNYRYITFGVLCIFWGIFMVVKSAGGLLNLWISDPTLCMAVDVITSSLFFIPVMCYLKSNMEGKRTRLIANILITLYTIRVVLALILHFAKVNDLYFSYTAVNISFYYFGLALTMLYQIVQVVIGRSVYCCTNCWSNIQRPDYRH